MVTRFAPAHADAVASSFGLMFMGDPSAALAEMARVTRPGGRMVVSTWGHVDDCPGFGGIIAAIESNWGSRATELLRTAFSNGRRESSTLSAPMRLMSVRRPGICAGFSFSHNSITHSGDADGPILQPMGLPTPRRNSM